MTIPLGALPTAAPRRRGRPGHDLEAVVSAATAVFTQRGFDATTMEHVAADLGIAKSTLYHHVSSKGELLERALERGLGALEQAFDEVESRDGSALDRLETAVQVAVRTLIDRLDAVTLLLRVRGNSPVERVALDRRRALDARFAALVVAAQADGALPARLDPHLAARLVFGTINSISEWYRPGRDPGELAAAVGQLVFRGLSR